MASHTVLQEAHLFCGSHWNAQGRKNNGVSPHGCRMKKEGCFLVLFFFLFQKHRCSDKQHKAWMCVCLCFCVCARLSPFTSTVLFRAALDHWNVLCHQKDSKKKKRKKEKTHQNKSMFAKLWEMLSGDLLTFVTFLVLPGNTGKKEQDDSRSTSALFSRR